MREIFLKAWIHLKLRIAGEIEIPGDTMEEVKARCPVCKKNHVLKKEVDTFFCRGQMLALVEDRLGWRLIKVMTITERQDRELDRLWGSEDEG